MRNVTHSPTRLRQILVLTVAACRTALGRFIVALGLAIIGALPMASPTAHAARALLAAPTFPGPQYGTAGTAAITPADFSFQCNTGPTNARVSAAGVAVAAGQGIFSLGCGQAQILLNTPASGYFRAAVAVADTAPAGSKANLQLLVLGPGGFNIHSAFVQVAKGMTRQVDVDVAGGVALAITFAQAPTVLYQLQLTGLARTLRPVPMHGTGMPAGATPVPKAAVRFSCNAGPANQQVTISDVSVPLTGTYQFVGCGTITVPLSAGAGGTLALRYGTDETLTNYTSIPAEVDLRVLDASGHLLRKAIGLSYVASGLQALWVDTRGGSTATLTQETGAEVLSVTSLSFLPGHYAPHPNPNHQEFGSPSGGAVDIAADALVNVCNASVGTNDISVAHQDVPRDSYVNIIGCGMTELIMTNAHGHFHARFGINDASTNPNNQETVTLVTLDQNSHPLLKVTVSAKHGGPAATLDASIDGASLLEVQSVSGGGLGVLFDMTLTGHATLYDRVFPPSEPPLSTAGGTPVDPRGFALACNVGVTTQDTLLIHQAALEQWSLSLTGCSTATLDVAKLPAPHRLFSVLYGLTVQDQHYGIGHLRLSVLDTTGKVLRTVLGVTRAGYGPRRLAISLAGGVKLQIAGVDAPLTVFALTTA